MQDATARVYERGGMEQFLNRIVEYENVDLSGTLMEIVAAFELVSPGSTRQNFRDLSAGVGAITGPIMNGLPSIDGREAREGDVFRLVDANDAGQPQQFDMTVRIYRRSSDNALAVAFGEDSITLKAAVSLSANEFFLDGNSVETNNITAAMEFTPVQCSPNYESTDGTTCVAATPTLNCDAASTTGQNGDECTCRTGYTQRISPEMCAMPQTGNNQQTGNNTQTSGGESESKAAKVIGVVGIGMAIFVIANGGLFSDAFAFSPDFGYSLTESGYAANAGGRIDFRKDNWHLYQSADSDFHRNGSLDFRYTSGGKYTADIWTATFSESVAGETADYNFALSANFRGGIWKISPNYRLHSEYEKGEFTTRNSLNLQSEFRYNRWTINPSAGFRWENANGFAENARFRLDAVHRF